MTPTALRWTTLLLGVLGFAMRVATTVWIHPLTWDMSGSARFLVLTAPLVAAIAILFGLFFVLSRGRRKPPAAFTPGDGRLTAQPSPYYAGTQSILIMYLAGGLLPTVSDGANVRLAEDASLWVVALIIMGAFVAVAMAFLWLPRPQLHLDPEGLTIQRVFGSTRLSWDEIAPRDPVPSSRRHLRIYLKSQPVAGPSIPVGWLDVDRDFLIKAIRHYAEHPEDRATIGAPQLKASTL